MAPTRPDEVTLSQPTARQLEHIAVDVGLAPPWQIAAQFAPAVPAEIHRALLAFRHARDVGALLMHGLGPGEVPENAESFSDLPAAGPLLLGIVALAAIPAFVPQEWDGKSITDVKVTAGLEETVSSKSRMALPIHQETQPLEYPADGLALMMVRGGSPTRVVAMRDVVQHMIAEEQAAALDVLRQPEFVHQTPRSVGESVVSKPMSILVGSDESPELKVDLATTLATTDSASSALSVFEAAASEIAFEVHMEPGTLFLIDNRRWLHGRGELKTTGRDRWLIRSYFVCDSWRAQQSDAGVMLVSP